MSELRTQLVGSGFLRSVLWASGIQMMAVKESLVERAMRAPHRDVVILREAAEHARKLDDGQRLFTVPTRLLDVLL